MGELQFSSLVLTLPIVFFLLELGTTSAFGGHFVGKTKFHRTKRSTTHVSPLSSSNWRPGDDEDANVWISSDDMTIDSTNWETPTLQDGNDGSQWTAAGMSSGDLSDDTQKLSESQALMAEEFKQDAWLDTLAQLSSEEVEFNMREADRADKARQMQEWGFNSVAITNTLDVATDTSLEDKDQVKGMQTYRNKIYGADYLEDLETVESHTKVEIESETGEPVRSQMVYVDEHACIGCTNCAMIAGNTFFMQQDYGRARVFSQWGDDDETIQIAIETCPVDCIHYVPYDELKRLEIDRRGMNINFKSRLVGSSDLSHQVGGAIKFSPPQRISGNMAPRCNNCPSRGCKNCPMYGVGKNPEFERKERMRKERIAKRKLENERDKLNKRANL